MQELFWNIHEFMTHVHSSGSWTDVIVQRASVVLEHAVDGTLYLKGHVRLGDGHHSEFVLASTFFSVPAVNQVSCKLYCVRYRQ